MDPVSNPSAARLIDAPPVMKWAAFLAAAGAVVVLCLLILRPFFGVLAWSSVLATTCHPLHRSLVRRTGRAALSAFLTSTLMVLAVVVPAAMIGAVVLGQLRALTHSLQQVRLDSDGMSRRVAAAVAPLTERVGLDVDAVVAWASGHATEWVTGAGQYTMAAAADIGGAFVSFAFTAFATFLLLRDGERLIGGIADLLPFERWRSEALLARIQEVVYASVFGVATIAAIQGVLCGGMFWLLGVPAAALWGLVAVFARMVPFVGTAAVWLPAAVYLAAIGAWPKALVLAVWGAAVVSSVDNVLRPRLVADRVRLGGVAMFAAMLGGLQAFGGLGIILGPVVFATGAAMLDLLRVVQSSNTPRADVAAPTAV
jgi:predicted PurR-regulated permease PerM